VLVELNLRRAPGLTLETHRTEEACRAQRHRTRSGRCVQTIRDASKFGAKAFMVVHR